MVSRIYLKCRACGKVTLARFEVGWLDAMPFAIACNNCMVILKGRLIQDQANVSLSLVTENADEVGETDDITQEVECSGEFPIRRYTEEPLGVLRPTPFIFAWSSMGSENYLRFKRNILRYLEYTRSTMPDLISLIELYATGDLEKARVMLNARFNGQMTTLKVSDVVSGMYDELSMVVRLLFPPGHYEEFTIPAIRYLGLCLRSNEQERKAYIGYLYGRYEIGRAEIEGLHLLVRFLHDFDYFLPVIGLSYWPENKIKRPLGPEYLLTTSDIDPIRQLYADCYEWICRCLPILVGAENIRSRGSYDKFPELAKKGQKKMNSLADFTHADNGIKIQLVSDMNNASISRFVSILDNRLRNAINHYKTKLHPVEQRIEYFPYKGAKKSKKSESIFLIDLTERCYWQFQAIHDLLLSIGALHCSKYN